MNEEVRRSIRRPGSDRTQSEGAGGERRQITALFYDIVGSTEFLNRLDPEDLERLQRATHTMASAAIARHGGWLDQVMGDGGCAFFGYPAPDEDAADGAVAAALEMLESIRLTAEDTNKSGDVPRIRIGIATGLVVIYPRGLDSGAGQNTVTGLAPTLAARLQSIADPNTIAVSNQTNHLTRGAFEMQSLGAIALKGFDDAQQVWRPLRRRAVLERYSGFVRFEHPFVGREREFKSIIERWQLAREGRGQVVELIGEPGMGKSRLAAELRSMLGGENVAARMFQCQPRGNSRPLHPFMDALKFEVCGAPDDPYAAGQGQIGRRGSLEVLLATCSAETREIISFLISADIAEDTQKSEYATLSGELFRRKALAAVVEIVEGWCRLGPQVLILEDLHWADTLTEALCAKLAVEAERLPMLLVVTTRRPVLAISAAAHTHAITLPRLDASAVTPIVAAAWQPQPVPAGLAAFIADKSDGVPLFVEELAVFLKERAKPSQANTVAWARVLSDGGIATLDDLLAARLASLGEARGLAQLAGVVGREFSLDLLTRLAAVARPSLAIETELATLLQSGLVFVIDAPGRAVFRFRHVLLQEVAYNSLLKSDRRVLHDHVVATVLDNVTIELSDEVMAWHCQQAGRSRMGALYGIRAGEAYAVRSAPHEAARMLDLAASSLTSCEHGPETDELILRLLAAQGPVAVALHGKGSSEARAIYDKGVSLCRDRAIEDREKWFPLYWGWWFTSPNGVIKRKRSDFIIRDLARANHPEIRLQALHCAWAANFHAGNHALCLTAIEQGLELYDPDRAQESRARYGGHDAKVCGLGERAQLQWLCANQDAAEEAIGSAIAWAEKTAHFGSIAHACDHALLLRHYQGRCADVAALADRLRSIAEAHALPGLSAKSRIFAGWADALLHPEGSGHREFEEGLALHLAIGTDEDLPIYTEMQAELLERAGKLTEAKQVLDTSIKHARSSANLFWLPELMRRRALVGRGTDEDPIICRTDLVQALALAEYQGSRALAARARADLERLEREHEVR